MSDVSGASCAILTVDGPCGPLHVRAAVERDADGRPFVALSGLDCSLEGEQPGIYYPTPLA